MGKYICRVFVGLKEAIIITIKSSYLLLISITQLFSQLHVECRTFIVFWSPDSKERGSGTGTGTGTGVGTSWTGRCVTKSDVSQVARCRESVHC